MASGRVREPDGQQPRVDQGCLSAPSFRAARQLLQGQIRAGESTLLGRLSYFTSIVFLNDNVLEVTDGVYVCSTT